MVAWVANETNDALELPDQLPDQHRGTRRAALGPHATPGQPPSRADPLRHRQVLIVGIHYRPEPVGIAPWTTGVAEHLAARGASVSVVTGLPHYPSGLIDEHYRGHRRLVQSPADGAGPTVVRLSHHVPQSATGVCGARYELSFARRAATARLPRRPDLVVGVTPGPGGAAAAARIAARHRAPLVVAVHDLVGRPGAARDGGIPGRLERYALDRADRVLVASRALSPAVAALGVPFERIGLVPNWNPHPAPTPERDAARARLGWSGDRFVLVHTGPMGLAQDLGSVIEAARRLPGDVEVVLAGDGSQRAALAERAAAVTNVRLLDPLDGERHALALAAADVLLVNERPSIGDLRLPSELAAYFSAGRPVLAAVSAGGATAAEIRRTAGAGMVVRPADPALLATAVLGLRNDRSLRSAMGQQGAAYAQSHLGRAATMAALDGLLDGLLHTPPP